MNDIFRKLYAYGIVPVVKIEDPEKAVPLAKALIDGGVNTCEITFRTARAAEAIKNITAAFPDMLVGAGTVLSAEQANKALEAGAKFIVSPGFNPSTVRYCVEKGVTIIPGCATCGEMEQAMEMGLEVVKFFPAEALGGVKVLKAVGAPYSKLKFMPTGGIDEKNIGEYLALSNVLACGGSFMVKASLIDSGDFAEITRLTKLSVAAVHNFSIKHVGINETSAANGNKTNDTLCRLFGLNPERRSEKAVFSGTLFEIMFSPYLGKNGHVAMSCLSPARARAYLEEMGAKFNESTASYDEKGNLKVIYLAEDIGGFAFHLVTK